MKVAIVHDWLVSMRGGERVLESLCRLYPRAHVYTLRYDDRNLSPEITSHEVRPSFVDRLARWLPLGRAGFRMLLPVPARRRIFARRLRSRHLQQPRRRQGAPRRLAPCTSPTYTRPCATSGKGRGVRRLGPGARSAGPRRAARGVAAPLTFDGPRPRPAATAATRRRGSTVTTDGRHRDRAARRRAPLPDPRSALGTGRRAALSLRVGAGPYKRVELAVPAGRRARLVVVGDGPERARLASHAQRGAARPRRDGELDRLYAECRAVIHPALDDF